MILGTPLQLGIFASTSFNPTSLGAVKSWIVGDDSENVMQGTNELPYESLKDIGVLDSTYDSDASAKPVSVLVGGRTAPIFRGKRLTQSSSSASEFSILRDATSDVSLSVSFDLFEVISTARLFSDNSGVATLHGIIALISGDKLQIRIGNGTGTPQLITSTVVLAAGRHDMVWRKTGTSFAFSVDGETEVTGTLTNPTSTDATTSLIIGNDASGLQPLNGIVHELVMHSEDNIGTSGVTRMREYFEDNWDTAPDHSFLAANGADVQMHFRADLGITLNGPNVSDWNDQSGYVNHLSAIVAEQPEYLPTGGPNSQSALQGAFQKAIGRTTFTNGAIDQPNTTYVIVEYSGGAADERVQDGQASRQIIRTDTTNDLYATTFVGTTAKPGSGVAGIIRAVFDDTSSSIRVEPDGASALSEVLSPGTLSLIGVWLGGIPLGASWLGTYSEAVFYDNDVPTVDATADAANRAAFSARYDIVHT